MDMGIRDVAVATNARTSRGGGERGVGRREYTRMRVERGESASQYARNVKSASTSAPPPLRPSAGPSVPLFEAVEVVSSAFDAGVVAAQRVAERSCGVHQAFGVCGVDVAVECLHAFRVLAEPFE